jgi:hypothetical protein
LKYLGRRRSFDVQTHDEFDSIVSDRCTGGAQKSFVPKPWGNCRVNGSGHCVLCLDVGVFVRCRLIPFMVGRQTHLKRARRDRLSGSSSKFEGGA